MLREKFRRNTNERTQNIERAEMIACSAGISDSRGVEARLWAKKRDESVPNHRARQAFAQLGDNDEAGRMNEVSRRRAEHEEFPDKVNESSHAMASRENKR